MSTVINIDPVTRLEGHLRVEVTLDAVGGQPRVVSAKVCGTSFRGFEQMLVGRDPREAASLTQRICGVCPLPHGVAAAVALERAAGQTVPGNARFLRNLVLGANFLQSHLLHFYQLSLLDYVAGPRCAPWTPDWPVDRRIDESDAARLVEHFQAALRKVRLTQEMGALFAGKLPHTPACVAGGFTTVPTRDQASQFRNLAKDLAGFIREIYLPDVEFVAAQYPEYSAWGRGPANFIAFGGIDLDPAGRRRFFVPGRIRNAGTALLPVDDSAIKEDVASSWYNSADTGLPPAEGATQPTHPKAGAYSWIKAPRYEGEAYEAGPLARQWIGGAYRRGVSVHDRHRARALEALQLAEAMPAWLDELQLGATSYADYATPAQAAAAGFTEAPRGALGHWLAIGNRKIERYQVLTPTCWNASPADDAGKPGPIEAALAGVPVQDTAQPIEVLRVIHSFDPCLACAVHVARPGEHARWRVI